MRAVVAAVTTWLASRNPEIPITLVELSGVATSSTDSTPLRFTSWRKDTVWNGNTYYREIDGNALKGGEGFTENAVLESPSASLEFASTTGDMQARFLADEFRGTDVVVTQLLRSQVAGTEFIWQTTYQIASDADGYRTLSLTLGSPDAAQGGESPRRQMHEHGCQFDFMKGGCPYRGPLTKCGKTVEDCRVRFPDLDVTIAGQTYKIRQALPYGAFPGGVPHRLVVR